MARLHWIKVTLLLMMLVAIAAAQSPLRDTDWKRIESEQKDFFVFVPDGYKVAATGSFYLPGTGRSLARVDSVVRLGRLVKGGAIIIEYYSGDAKQLQDVVEERSDCSRVGTGEVHGFTLRYFRSESKGVKCRGVSARRKNNLYVVQSFSSHASEVLINTLFDSIRLVEQGTTRNTSGVSDPTILLPKVLDAPSPIVSDSGPIEESEADRKPVLLATPRPRNPMPSIGLKSGRKVTVAVKVLLAATGEVSVISAEKGLKSFHTAAREAAQNLVFIPAEKAGKVVSVYKTMEYSF